MSGPLTLVLDAARAGGSTRADIARRTGLSLEMVGASVDHLVRLGRLQGAPPAGGCAAGGCGGCPVAARCAVGRA